VELGFPNVNIIKFKNWKHNYLTYIYVIKLKIMNKQQTIELLSKQLPGFYSVEQVIELIKNIEESGPTLTKASYDELVETLIDNIDGYGVDAIGNYELEMSDREVTLEQVSFDYRTLHNAITNTLEDYIEVAE
jgi:translation initiation factor RLI1